MGYLTKIIIIAVLFLVAGCASHPSHPIKTPLAVAQPLAALSANSAGQDPLTTEGNQRLAPLVTFSEQDDGLTALQGPMVRGTRGDGLNVATSLYQLFTAMGLQTEVSCDARSLADNPEHYDTHVQIFFRSGLSSEQKRDVARVLSSAQFLPVM